MFLSECVCSVMGLILPAIYVLMGLFSPAARAAGTVPHPLPHPVPHPHPLPHPVPHPHPDPVPSGEQEQLEPPYLHLPVFLHFRKPRVDKRHFAPAHVKSRESLPMRVRQVLVPAPRRRPKSRVRQNGPVSVACNAREMRVRVHMAHLGAGGVRANVRLGTCDVSKRTELSVLFRYELHRCGTQRQIINQTVVYSNMLHYVPDAGVPGSETLSVPVECHFNRFHYSYKIGFLPSVERMKFFKPIKTKGSVTLAACDAQWNRLSPTEGFSVGQPMYFEAETLYVPDDERLFVHFCHVTMNSSRVSLPQVKIIDNYGCLINSKSSSQSRFIDSTRRNVVRFTIDAFTLQEEVQKHLFIHCEMSIRSIVPTETSKSCTYNQLEHRWEELYGAHTVCSCCDSSCVPEIPTLMRPLTSELGALVNQHPEGKSRSSPTQSTIGMFSTKPEHGILMTESQHKTIVPERTIASEHEPRTTTMEKTPMLENKHLELMPESEHGKITPENTPTLEDKHGTQTPDNVHTIENMPTPSGDRGMPTPSGDRGMPTPSGDRGMPTPSGDRGMPTPGSECRKITPGNTPTLEDKHRVWVPDSEQIITLETRPTLESEHRTSRPDSEHKTPMPDIDNEIITTRHYGTFSPRTHTPSVEQNTPTPVYKLTELREPYRIFEEVFGLS